MQLPLDIDTVKGFLAPEEGEALFNLALDVADIGPCLEIGSYCGKSTVYLGTACKQTGNTLFALDHHRGSEEHQPGEEYHDPELFDPALGAFDTFREFRRTMTRADLDDHVVPLVTSSAVAGRHWQTPLGLVFIDGGHSFEAAETDYVTWAEKVAPGGILAIHDLFPNPEEGGQAPITIYRRGVDSGLFEVLPVVGTLGVLRRKDG